MPDKDEHQYLGKTLGGRYRIIEVIGKGGMAVVYRAVHELIGHEVAIKVLLPKYLQTETAYKRFVREAQVVNLINHENVLGISDLGETEEGVPYLVMDYLKGSPLQDLLNQFEFPVKLTLDILVQVCEGIGKAHSLNIVHRDISGSNIFLIQGHGQTYRVKILDFGIAFIKDQVRLTAPGTVLGTPWYMAPEAFMGSTATPATDIYSIGCVVYEMLSGQLPFAGDDWQEVSRKHLNETPVDIKELTTVLPEGLGEIVMKCLSKKSEHRFKDGYELLGELQMIVGIPQDDSSIPELHEDMVQFEPTVRSVNPLKAFRDMATDDHLALIDKLIEKINELGSEIEERTNVLEALREQAENAESRYNIAIDALKNEDMHIQQAIRRVKKGLKTEEFDYNASLQAARLKVLALEESFASMKESQVVSQKELERSYREIADLYQKKAKSGQFEIKPDTQYEILKNSLKQVKFQIRELESKRDSATGVINEKIKKLEKTVNELSEERTLLHKNLLSISSKLAARRVRAPTRNLK